MKHLAVDIQLNYENLEMFCFFRTNFFQIFDSTVFISFVSLYHFSTYDIEASSKLVYKLILNNFVFKLSLVHF